MNDISLPGRKTLSSEFERLEQSVCQALKSYDIIGFADLLDDCFVAVSFFGDSFGKDRFLDEVRQYSEIKTLEILTSHFIEEPGFVVVLSEWNVNVKSHGAVLDGIMRITRVWVKRPTGWKILTTHLSDARAGKALKAMESIRQKK